MSWDHYKKGETKSAIVVFSRPSEGKYQMSLNEGMKVELLAETDGWYKVRYENHVGIYPSNHVKVIGQSEGDALSKIDKQDKEKYKRALQRTAPTATELMRYTESALISEILQVLREWSNELIKLRTEKRREEFLAVKKQMAILVGLKKLICSMDLQNNQTKLQEISDKVINVIEEGSRQLNLDLIVRVDKGDKKGQRAHEGNTPVVELFRQYQKVQRKEMDVRNMRELKQELHRIGAVKVDADLNDPTVKTIEDRRTQLIKRVLKNYDPTDRVQRIRQIYDLPSGSISLLLEVKACLFTMGEPTEVYFSLYNKQQKKFVSEEYMVELTALGMPKDERLIQNIRTLFVDISEIHYTGDMYLVCRIYRKGKMVLDEKATISSSELLKKSQNAAKEDEDPEEETFYRRPFGCAVLPLTPDIISEFLMGGKELAPGNLALFNTVHEPDFPYLHEMIINKTGNFERLPHSRAIGIAIGITMFHNKTISQIMEDNPLLKLGKTVCITKAHDFTEVISPDERRNDLYVTMLGGNFNDARNVKITCHVMLKGKFQEPIKCIRRHSGLYKEPYNYYHSSVYYHIHNPFWNETICVDLSPENLEDAVLVFVFSHCSNHRQRLERFAVSFFDIVDKDTSVIIPDSEEHKVELFKYSKDMDKGFAAYVTDRTKLLSLKSYLNISTKLVSTRCTQDSHLNNLLKWNKKTNIPLDSILERFSYVNMQDVVKYIREISDALFSILISNDNEKAADLVYNALLRIIDGLSNKNFSRFRKSLDEYIQKYFNFPSPQIHKWLLHSLIKHLTWDENDKKKAKDISQSLRAFHYMFRFIVTSRSNCEKASNNNSGAENMMSNADYKSQTENVFSLLNKVISIQNNTALIAAQDQMLKFVGPLFEIMSDIFPSNNFSLLGVITRQFLQSIPDTGRNNTIEGKLSIVSSVCRGNMLLKGEVRKELLEYIISLVKHHMNRSLSERRMCVRIVADMAGTLQKLIIDTGMDHNEAQDSATMSIKQSFLLLFELLPDIHEALHELKKEAFEAKAKISRMMETSNKVSDDELFNLNVEFVKIEDARSELMSTAIAFFYIMDEKMLDSFMKPRENKIDCIYYMLNIFHDMIENSPIPEYWIAFNVFCFNTVYSHFKRLTAYLRKYISFSYEIWNKIFHLAVKFARSKFLQIEGYSLSKQSKILVHGDLRVLIIKHFRELWESLSTDQQMNFVPNLVDSVLRLPAAIPKKDIYVDALNIYYCILQLEYKATKSLRQCQGITGYILDEHIVKDQIDSTFKQFFEEVLAEKFQSDPTIREEGIKFLDNTKMLIELIGAVHRYNDDQEDQKTTSLIKVMQYVANSDQQDIYFKYIHALADVHVHNKNYVEAAFTLMLHSEKLSFESTKMLPVVGNLFPDNKERQEREIKVALYLKAIDYFDKGRDWERAIKLARILAPYFEHTTYKYEKLAEMLKLQGDLFLKIADQKRLYSSYFYVAYYGKSFQEMGLRNKEFIYKGDDAERLMDFVERIMKRFPNAEMLKPLEQVSEEKMNGDGQYIQIMTVYPSSFEEIETKCAAKPRNPIVSKNIAGYEQLNIDVKVFMYSKTFRKNPKDKEMNEFRDLYTTLNFLIIGEQNEKETDEFNANRFPTIVRRKPILRKQELLLTPVENAVKNIEDKNAEIMELVISHELDKKPDTGKLSMSLNGTIDAAVNGGVNKYVDAFFAPDYIMQNPSLLPAIQRLQKALDDQLVVLGNGLEMYRKHGSAQTKAHVEHLYSYWANMKDQLSTVTTKDLSLYLKGSYGE